MYLIASEINPISHGSHPPPPHSPSPPPPAIGFGIMDNFVMITAGEAIDSTFGVMFGLSTMAAAGTFTYQTCCEVMLVFG